MRAPDTASLRLACSCGKRYRIDRKEAGRSFRCKRCLESVQVPGQVSLTSDDCRGILEELGIDAGRARAAWEEAQRFRRCFFCARQVNPAKVPGTHGAEVICSSCRGSPAEIGPRLAVPESPIPPLLSRIERHRAAKTLMYFAFVFLGHAGLASTLGLPPSPAFALAAVVGLLGARLVYADGGSAVAQAAWGQSGVSPFLPSSS